MRRSSIGTEPSPDSSSSRFWAMYRSIQAAEVYRQTTRNFEEEEGKKGLEDARESRDQSAYWRIQHHLCCNESWRDPLLQAHKSKSRSILPDSRRPAKIQEKENESYAPCSRQTTHYSWGSITFDASRAANFLWENDSSSYKLSLRNIRYETQGETTALVNSWNKSDKAQERI